MYIQVLHPFDTEANWNEIGDQYIPGKGEIIFYQIEDSGKVKFKVGDGKNYLNALPFQESGASEEILNNVSKAFENIIVQQEAIITKQNELLESTTAMEANDE